MYSQKFVAKDIFNHGSQLLSKYSGNSKKITVVCSQGHIFPTTYSSIKRSWKFDKNGCSECYKKIRFLTQKSVATEISKNGSELLSEYLGNSKKITVKCPQGHVFLTTYSILHTSYKNGFNGCQNCNKINRTLTQKDVATKISKNGSELLSDYLGCNKEIIVKCPQGHIFSTIYPTLQTAYKKNNTGCPYCHSETFYGENIKKGRVFIRLKAAISTQENIPYQNVSNLFLDQDLLEISSKIEAFYLATPQSLTVDHIIPLTWFDHSNLEDIKVCWSIHNLRYLTFVKNSARGNRPYDSEISLIAELPGNLIQYASQTPSAYGKIIKMYKRDPINFYRNLQSLVDAE